MSSFLGPMLDSMLYLQPRNNYEVLCRTFLTPTTGGMRTLSLLVTLPVALIRDSDESNSREKSLFRLTVSRDHFPTVRKTWLQVGKAKQQEQ